MQISDLGAYALLGLGAIGGAVTAGPLGWLSAKFDRAVNDRRTAWHTHRSLISTIWSLGGRIIGIGVIGIVCVAVFVAALSHRADAGDHHKLPNRESVSSSSSPR